MPEITGNIALLGPNTRADATARRAAERTTFGWWQRARREPFLHFLILGGALFAVSHYLDARSHYTKIVVTRDTIANIAESYRLQYGRLPTRSQLDSLSDGYIRDQVYYQEALRLGLDQDDEIVRRRLVQKYEFLQQDMAIEAEPTEAQLEAYLQQHADRYRTPDTLTFTQVYFSVDRRGDAGARKAAEDAADALNLTGRNRAPEAGDPFPGPEDFPDLTQDEARRVFGAGALTDELFHQPVGHWSAPLRSAYGWHIVHVGSLTASRPAELESVKEQVRRDFIDDERAARNEANFAQLRKRFEIVRE